MLSCNPPVGLRMQLINTPGHPMPWKDMERYDLLKKHGLLIEVLTTL
ncbi:MAG: hypothetical protein BWY09_00657 [Candidatus Hydrogenedentes bacterium ADurb.Bin179]|nr:MAG: hypothetical protein BWY09_00657 [Candidatus Hydrogenedentes bacterium ADurb.Bin179]